MKTILVTDSLNKITRKEKNYKLIILFNSYDTEGEKNVYSLPDIVEKDSNVITILL